MKEGAVLLVVLLLLLTSFSVQASTDYRCLKLCLAQGGNYYTCNPSCRFAEEKGNQGNQDMLVKTPLPWQGDMLRKEDFLSRRNQEKDYLCLKKCLSEGLQYGFCTIRCEKR